MRFFVDLSLARALLTVQPVVMYQVGSSPSVESGATAEAFPAPRPGRDTVRYGFVVDNRRCIGCHACSVACKSENRVPLGVFRTWVKYVEKGWFPHSRRYFQVTRCNHCANPPCVTICPVGAMIQRRDGIVDFDRTRCIGCKACLQACPYDAIYIDPDDRTAAKCHFCAHRVDVGLEPACVVACPERAILAGDLDDPDSEVSQVLARHTVQVRKPEQGTQPKLFYVDGEESAIVPGAARSTGTYLWATVNQRANRVLPLDPAALAAAPAVLAYDVEHARPWDWQVPVLFWTKTIASGVFAVPALAGLAGASALQPRLDGWLAVLALALIAVTVGLLVSDLSRPDRFHWVVTRSQPRSWMSRGGWFLGAYTGLCVGVGLASWLGLPRVSDFLVWPTVLGGGLAAVYTAFLLGQCEGCDLWQTPVLPVHLAVRCVLTSAAVLALLPAAGWLPVAVTGMAAGLVLHVLALLGEIGMPRATYNARYAARLMTHGPLRGVFWLGAVGVGTIVPLVLLAFGHAIPAVIRTAAVLTLLGQLAFEWCFVMAGQAAPNS